MGRNILSLSLAGPFWIVGTRFGRPRTAGYLYSNWCILGTMGSEKTILCVDDDTDDRYLLRDEIGRIAPDLRVVEVENGLEAMVYLNDAKEKRQLPCLVVLDINMPFMDGRQTLEKIRMDKVLQTLPVVIFTSSQSPADKAHFKKRGVTMMSKPFDIRFMEHIVKDLITICR